MSKFLLLFACVFSINIYAQNNEYIERQGQVTFFSYTAADNIQAENNQVLSIFNVDDKEIAVSILMRAFVFEKTLMREHFNESYIESDLYPKATFSGKIVDFDNQNKSVQTKIIKGEFALKGVSKQVEIKVKISNTKKGYNIEGAFDVLIKDFPINIPPLLSPNISKKIEVLFNFNYVLYEE